MNSLVKGASVLALAAIFVAPALADNHHHHSNAPAGPALTTVSNTQANGGQVVTSDGQNKASINDNAFETSSGNVGANVASGAANQQANSTYIDGGSTTNDVDAASGQLNGFNFVFGSGDQNATIENNAFESAKGNVNANVAAGNLNQQSNATVITSLDVLSAVTAGAVQGTGLSTYVLDGFNNATITDDAFASASGNVGANVASGNANQQANELVINK